MTTIRDIQLALQERGHDPGPIDGIWGRKSIAATREFQKAAGLDVDGIAGPKTLVALLKPTGFHALADLHVVPMIDPAWYLEAKRFMGLKEVAGPANNPTIMGWAANLKGWVASYYKMDSTPWCGLSCAAWIAATLPEEVLPANPLGALNWAKFGVELKVPAVGAVVVFSRVGGGHVGFYVGEDATAVHVLGGNQSDAINVARVAKTRLVATRWPATAPLPTTGRVLLAAKGSLSKKEA